MGVRIDADTQKAGQVHALGAIGAAAQNAGQSTVFVAAALVLKDAHGLGGSALWDVRWAGAGVALGGTHAATGTLHLSLGLVLLARRLLIVAGAGSRRGWGRRRRGRRWRWRWALAGHNGVRCLALDAALTRSRLATLQLHVTGFTPGRSPLEVLLHEVAETSHGCPTAHGSGGRPRSKPNACLKPSRVRPRCCSLATATAKESAGADQPNRLVQGSPR